MKKLFTILAIFFACVCVNAQNATVILNVPSDIWGDGTGYQILLDANGDAFQEVENATTLEQISALIACGNVTFWNMAEYKIPANADPSDNNIVVSRAETLSIPAGLYYYLIVNPNCEASSIIYLASNQCDPSESILQFGADSIYTFTLSVLGNGNDCVTLTVEPVEPVDPGTGVNDVTASNVSIYPNPATDVLNVTAEGFNNVEILNFLGQVVYSSNVSNSTMQINTADLTAGVYFVRLNGETTVTKKFTKM